MDSLLEDSGGCFGGSGSSSNNRRHQNGYSALSLCIVVVFFVVCGGILLYRNLDKRPHVPGLLSKKQGNIVYYDVPVCSTTQCKEAAKEIISSLNTSVDPCENFYEYACQGWQANNPRPEYSPQWTVFSKLENKTSQFVSEILSNSVNSLPTSDEIPALKHARIFYQSCMGTYSQSNNDKNKYVLYDPLETDNVNLTKSESTHAGSAFANDDNDSKIYNIMLNTINEHGGWPLLQDPGSWNSLEFDLTKAMVNMKQKFNSPIFLDVISVQDSFGQVANNSIYITQPSTSGSLIDNLIVDADIHAVKTIFALRDFIVDISKELLNFQGKTNINETYLEDIAWQIIIVEGELHKASEKKADIIFKIVYGISPLTAKTNPTELQYWLDSYTGLYDYSIQIDKLLVQLYGMFYKRYPRPITVPSMDYILSVSKYITQLKYEVLANYVMFKMVTTMIPYSTQKMQDHFNKLKNVLDGTTGKMPKSKICTALTQERFSLAVGHAYVQKTVFNNFKSVNKLFYGTKQVFVDLVTRSTIPYINKIILLAKLKITELCLGYPKVLNDTNQLEIEHYGLTLHHTTFLEKLMAVNTWVTDKQLDTIIYQADLIDVCKWPRFAGMVGAFNQLQDFLVYLPFGMLQSPFYKVGLPEALNYGTLGSILGHEIVHGLLGPGWLDSDNGTITKFSECLVDQYENFSTPELQKKNITLNGLQTLKENIPDNVGLQGAYVAYKRQEKYEKLPKELSRFTGDQLFFIGFAQNWCHSYTPESFQKTVENDKHGPGMFRVLGSLQNSKEFASAWNCPVGSKMNPSLYEHEKCRFLES